MINKVVTDKIKHLRGLNKEELKYIISFKLNRLLDDEDTHLRFDMSGYGDARKLNQDILALFEDYGIYDSTQYLYLDTHKGIVSLFYHMWENNNDEKRTGYMDLSGMGTRDILEIILTKFVIDYNGQFRRRDRRTK